MELLYSNTSINYFLPYQLLSADSKSIIKLMPFIEDGFFPGYAEVASNDSNNKVRTVRIDKSFGDYHVGVTFAPWAVSITFESQKSVGYHTLVTLLDHVLKLFNATFEQENIKGGRVSVVINDACKSSPENEGRLYSKFFKLDSKPVEWMFRNVLVEQFKDEKIFNILSITKAPAVINVKGNIFEGDSILINVDNNTHPDNSDLRFSMRDSGFIKDLLNEALENIKDVKEL
ncbi:hypothetical protein ABUK00_07750 [Raoultella planticola]|uniref:hypothetical protein n=1 Tax=Raoultella planticola TaxID=575 RepID=UPI0015F1841F|nr:hypothetical protein [Raoultella planticola]MDY7622547.1 hypothetical protein [Raoultella planticola]